MWAFEACAGSLHWLALKLDPWFPGGMNYVKINVIIFVILLPLVLLGLVAAVITLW